MSWDPTAATMSWSDSKFPPAWSPCSRFIAVPADHATVQILDAVTLKQLKSLTPPHCYTRPSPLSYCYPLVTFSPESCLLTWSSARLGGHISWDLQTGIPVSIIPMGVGRMEIRSITYSECGTMFGALFTDNNTATIDTYNVLSGTSIYSHPIKGLVAGKIWTCGEHIRFVTFVPGFMTVWEVRFTSKCPVIEVKSLPTPINFNLSEEDPSSLQYIILPIHFRLAFILEETVIVWDACYSKFLLNSPGVEESISMDFSPDGCFFACRTHLGEICLWKESQTGYILHKTLTSNGVSCGTPTLSPNGQSIIGSDTWSLQLWHTTDSTTSSITPISSDLAPLYDSNFIVQFSPDRSLVVVAQLWNDMATVINLRSGVTQLMIDTGMEVGGLGITWSTIIVVGDGKIITWNLPVGDHIPNARVNVDDSIQITTINHLIPLGKFQHLCTTLISPNFNHVAILEVEGDNDYLNIYDVATGKHLIGTRGASSFILDGHEAWCYWPQWRASLTIEDSESKLVYLDKAMDPPEKYPWDSPHGYQIRDGWILSSSGKRLLWLPHHWRHVSKSSKIWSEQFLALLHSELPEVVILELP